MSDCKYKATFDPASEGDSKFGVSVFCGTGGDLETVEEISKWFKADTYSPGKWSPFGATGQGRKIGPGLFEYLKDGNICEYNPVIEKRYKDYELTPEEHARFDAIEGATKEEIEMAKKVLSKTLRVEKNSIDDIAKIIEEMWFDRVPKPEENKLILYSPDLLNEMLNLKHK